MSEIYRELDFLGFIGYRVGSCGTVWSKLVQKSLGGKRGFATVVGDTWKQLKPLRDTSGHFFVILSQKGKPKHMLVHRLVALSFIGEPLPGQEVRHFPDRNTANNRVDNLVWGTHQENCADATLHGTQPRGETNGRSRLTEKQVIEIRELFATGKYLKKEIAPMFGIHPTYVGQIVNRRTWKHIN